MLPLNILLRQVNIAMDSFKSIPVSRAAQLTYTAAGAVLIAVCSWISVPAAVPFTLQTFAVFFVLSLLGGKWGTLSILVYILLGAAGIPVFSNFQAGIGVLLGSTGGYIAGFLFLGLIYRAFTKSGRASLWLRTVSMVLGLAALYAFGTLWFALVYLRSNGSVSIPAVLGWCVLPFVIPDLLKMALALVLSRRISSALHLRL